MCLAKKIDIVQFLEAVKKCAEDVFLETDEGDRLNLKSTLSQYVLAACAGDRGFLEKDRIICTEEDVKYLEAFLEMP